MSTLMPQMLVREAAMTLHEGGLQALIGPKLILARASVPSASQHAVAFFYDPADLQRLSLDEFSRVYLGKAMQTLSESFPRGYRLSPRVLELPSGGVDFAVTDDMYFFIRLVGSKMPIEQTIIRDELVRWSELGQCYDIAHDELHYRRIAPVMRFDVTTR